MSYTLVCLNSVKNVNHQQATTSINGFMNWIAATALGVKSSRTLLALLDVICVRV
jgi:hypothetical protein